MLIVVEDGHVGDGFEFPFDLEAAGSADVLQIHAAEGAEQQRDGADELIDVFGPYAKGDGVDVSVGLEEEAFAFHDGHTGFGADIAES